MDKAQSRARLIDVKLDEKTLVRRSPEVEHERAIAIYDLLEDNHFEPVGCGGGPYKLFLSLQENRLIFDVRDSHGAELGRIPVPLMPFRRIVKEYFEICQTYYDAIKTAPASRIEAIDMGRRGLHNDGAELLRDRLKGKIEVDENTSRRLFTLFCVLHIRG